MTKLLERAIEALKRLPDADQDSMAREVLTRIEEEAEWDHLVASPKSQSWLEDAARQALEEHARGETLPVDPSDR